MRSSNRRMHAGRVSAVVAFTLLAVAALAAHGLANFQNDKQAAPSATSFVGVWHASAPNGLRVATLTVVPAGGGLAGAFLGYDYDRPLDPSKPVEGAPPKVSMRSGSVLLNPALDGAGALAFAMQLRPLAPPPGAPDYFDIRGEMRVSADGAGELKLFSPKKPEPMTLKLTRE